MERQRSSKTRTRIKLFAAVVGACAVVSMAALGMGQAPLPEPDAVAKSTSMRIGRTTTLTTAPHSPAVGLARPTITGPAPLPSEEAAAK